MEITKAVIAKELSKLFDLLNAYGKKATQDKFANTINGFYDVLATYPCRYIVEAFREWLKENNKLPAPADIRKIIINLHEYTSLIEYKKTFQTEIDEFNKYQEQERIEKETAEYCKKYGDPLTELVNELKNKERRLKTEEETLQILAET